MFRRRWFRTVVSDEGFSVTTPMGRAGKVRYREGDRYLGIDSEMLGIGGDLALYTQSIQRWDPPYDGETISDEKRREIVKNCVRALQYDGLVVEVDWER